MELLTQAVSQVLATVQVFGIALPEAFEER